MYERIGFHAAGRGAGEPVSAIATIDLLMTIPSGCHRASPLCDSDRS
jgi:hypothetical protein